MYPLSAYFFLSSIGSHTLATFPERGKQGVISKAKPKNTNDKRQSVTKQAKPARKGKAREQRFFDREKQATPLDFQKFFVKNIQKIKNELRPLIFRNFLSKIFRKSKMSCAPHHLASQGAGCRSCLKRQFGKKSPQGEALTKARGEAEILAPCPDFRKQSTPLTTLLRKEPPPKGKPR